jgi:dUTP pyrophosphatase
MSNSPVTKVKFLDPEAKRFGLPLFAYEGDAGADLRVILPKDQRETGVTIYPGDRILLSCGIALDIAPGYWGRLTHRSSTERRLRLRVVEGTIDNGFKGELFTQVHNPNTFPINISHGDRIAQIIFHKLNQMVFEEVNELAQSDRGTNGFGSSGKK